MDIGAFILGILFGWLVEWIYVNFFGSKNSNSLSDCSSYERELKTRNEEIKALKAELGVNSGAAVSLKSTSSDSASIKREPGEKSKSTTKSESSVADKTSSSTLSASSSKSASPSTAKKTTTKASATSKAKAAPKKITTKKASTAKKPSSVAKKSTAKKPVKKIALKKNIGKKMSGDDFTKLSGIGPSMATKLNELDITTYEKLAAMDDDILRDMLETSGARLNNNKEDMDTWNEQATLASKGDFKGLKEFQDKLKK